MMSTRLRHMHICMTLDLLAGCRVDDGLWLRAHDALGLPHLDAERLGPQQGQVAAEVARGQANCSPVSALLRNFSFYTNLTALTH
jgi:hypothetical protein